MPIITLGTTEPDGIIVETGTLPSDFYSRLRASEVEMQEPVELDTKASLIAKYMRDSDDEEEKQAQAQKKKLQNTQSNKSNARKRDDTKNVEGVKVRGDLLEFSSRSDGSVNCKLCGKIFATRQHWYRHKYRAHVVDPVPLNKCEKCLIFFKSRKGYLGHMSSKHNESPLDAALPRNERATLAKPQETEVKPSTSLQPKVADPEMVIPRTIVHYKSVPSTSAASNSRSVPKPKSADKKKTNQSTSKAAEEIDPVEYQERRVKDESFVLGIIEKVRRQCATEPGVASRRGYSRKPYSVKT